MSFEELQKIELENDYLIIKLPKFLHNEFRAYCKTMGYTKSALIKMIIQGLIKQIRDPFSVSEHIKKVIEEIEFKSFGRFLDKERKKRALKV